MNKCIGIISYLPDNKEIRDSRISLLNNLINFLDSKFNLPIIIVAQNYKNYIPNSSNIILYEFNKLGIVGARNKLREIFLNSNYDCLIMLDDDCQLYGTKEGVKDYLIQLDNNPNMFYEFNKTLLKLFAISKELFKEIKFENINPENEEGFEDRIFVNTLRKKFPTKQYIINKHNLEEISVSTQDNLSTWYTNQDIKKMLKNTEDIINNM